MIGHEHRPEGGASGRETHVVKPAQSTLKLNHYSFEDVSTITTRDRTTGKVDVKTFIGKTPFTSDGKK